MTFVNPDTEAAPVTVTAPRAKKEPLAEKVAKAKAKAETEAPAEVEPEPVKEAPKAEPVKSAGVDVNMLREKVGKILRQDAEKRNDIKSKLAELEADGVGALDPAHYDAFNDFLNSLAS
jgi:hypothetical protein